MHIGWNNEAIAGKSKDDFVKEHQHLKDHADLEKVWENAQPPKKEEKKPQAEKKAAK